MARVDQRDVVRTRESDEPSPNEVAGYHIPDEDNPQKLTDEWVEPVDPATLDPDAHVAMIPVTDRDASNVMSVPLADASESPLPDPVPGSTVA